LTISGWYLGSIIDWTGASGQLQAGKGLKNLRSPQFFSTIQSLSLISLQAGEFAILGREPRRLCNNKLVPAQFVFHIHELAYK
jgi:hypothetical protein